MASRWVRCEPARNGCLAAVDQCWTQKAPKISAREIGDARQAYDHAREVYRKLIAESEKQYQGALNDHLVFGLDQAAWVVAGGDVMEMDVARQGAEEGDAVSNEHGDASDDEAVHEAGAQKLLNSDAAVHVDVLDATGSEFGNNFGARPGHLLDTASAHGGEIEGAAAEDHHAFISVRPFGKSQNGFEGFAADDEGVHAGEELVVAVRFAAAGRKKVEVAVRARNETVNAGSDEDRYGHRGLISVEAKWRDYTSARGEAGTDGDVKSPLHKK